MFLFNSISGKRDWWLTAFCALHSFAFTITEEVPASARVDGQTAYYNIVLVHAVPIQVRG
jgi:hypothetical protein